ncbi:MAG TPA: PAS domain S-box protein [Bryobacteraceae bacterium]
MDAVPDALVVDPAGKIALVNAQTEKIFEYFREELVGQPRKFLVPEPFRGLHAGHRAAFHRPPRARPRSAGLELFARKNGPQFPVEISLSPLEFCGIKLVYSCIHRINERKSSEESRRILRGNEALLSEIYQRAKNNLQVVCRLLNLQARRLADPAARHMVEVSQSRIRSLTPDLRLVKVLTRQPDGKLRARRLGVPKFEIVFRREARRKFEIVFRREARRK